MTSLSSLFLVYLFQFIDLLFSCQSSDFLFPYPSVYLGTQLVLINWKVSFHLINNNSVWIIIRVHLKFHLHGLLILFHSQCNYLKNWALIISYNHFNFTYFSYLNQVVPFLMLYSSYFSVLCSSILMLMILYLTFSYLLSLQINYKLRKLKKKIHLKTVLSPIKNQVIELSPTKIW